MTSSIICLGDSITFGYPIGPEFSWVEQLQQRTNKNLINLGVNGSTSRDMLHHYKQYTSSSQVTHVHILGGGNDALQQLEWTETRRNIQNLVDLVIQQGAVPMLGLLTPLCYDPAGGGAFVPSFAMEALATWKAHYRNWLRDYANNKSVLLIDYYTPLCIQGTDEGDGQFFYDESHLNEKGHALMADVAERTWLNF